jgi:hypothetical protein
MVVREASSQHPETAAESIRTGGFTKSQPNWPNHYTSPRLWPRSREKQDDFIDPAKP